MTTPALPPASFHNFDHTHIAVMVLTIAVPLALAAIARKTRSPIFIKGVAVSFAIILAVNFIAQALHLAYLGEFTFIRFLPMQLCDWAMFVTILALLTRSQRWFELAYFWGIGGTLQAIITPNLTIGFPAFSFLTFFIVHCGIVASIIFMLLAMNLRPRPASLLRVPLWSEAYLACALLVNYLCGTNYGFLTHKPAGASILSILSDSPSLYVAQINLVALFFFLILYLPFFLGDFIAQFRTPAGASRLKTP